MRRPLRTVLTLAIIGGLTAACFGGTDEAKGGSLAQNASLSGLTVTVGGKEFTEQLVLCQMTALALRSAGATVKEKCGLQGSNTTREALTTGSIDMYWEYTGTAWVNYLKHTDAIKDPTKLYDTIAKEDLDKNQVQWLTASPANNTYAIVVKTTTATELNVTSLTGYAALTKTNPTKASMCVAAEFAGRDDGLPGLEKAYGFTVPKGGLANLAEGAIYNSVAKNNPCNFGEAATTDGRIKALQLTVLKDDKQFFPVYNPALTVRSSVYQGHQDIGKIMEPIAKALTDDVLQDLNGQVDVQGKDPADVAKAWLVSKGFIGS
jgi:osmoprotectant transport system substrate-binding protein